MWSQEEEQVRAKLLSEWAEYHTKVLEAESLRALVLGDPALLSRLLDVVAQLSGFEQEASRRVKAFDSEVWARRQAAEGNQGAAEAAACEAAAAAAEVLPALAEHLVAGCIQLECVDLEAWDEQSGHRPLADAGAGCSGSIFVDIADGTSVKVGEVPVEVVEVPVEVIEAPVEVIEAPVELVVAPGEVVEAPVEVTPVVAPAPIYQVQGGMIERLPEELLHLQQGEAGFERFRAVCWDKGVRIYELSEELEAMHAAGQGGF